MRINHLIALSLLLTVTAATLGGCSKPDDGFPDSVSFTLPDDVELLEYREETGFGGGCLLSPKLHDGVDGTPDEWMYTGVICRFPAERALWEDGRITDITPLWNHTVINGSRSVDGLAAPALLLEAEHELYTAAELGRLEEEGAAPAPGQEVSTYRYVFLARPEEEWGYVISLDAGAYTEDDLLEFAGSFRY